MADGRKVIIAIAVTRNESMVIVQNRERLYWRKD